jgi:hypothetical protein
VAASLATATRPSPIAPLGQAAAAAELDPGTRVQLRHGLQIGLDETDDVVSLRLPDGPLAVAPAQRDALAVLLDGEPCGVDSLPGDPEAISDLVRALLVRGVIVPTAR